MGVEEPFWDSESNRVKKIGTGKVSVFITYYLNLFITGIN